MDVRSFEEVVFGGDDGLAHIVGELRYGGLAAVETSVVVCEEVAVRGIADDPHVDDPRVGREVEGRAAGRELGGGVWAVGFGVCRSV